MAWLAVSLSHTVVMRFLSFAVVAGMGSSGALAEDSGEAGRASGRSKPDPSGSDLASSVRMKKASDASVCSSHPYTRIDMADPGADRSHQLQRVVDDG